MFGPYWLASKSVSARDVLLQWFQTRTESFSALSGDSAPSANHGQPRVFSGEIAARLHVSSPERTQMFQVVAAKSETRLRVKSLAPHPLTSSPLDTLPQLLILYLNLIMEVEADNVYRYSRIVKLGVIRLIALQHLQTLRVPSSVP